MIKLDFATEPSQYGMIRQNIDSLLRAHLVLKQQQKLSLSLCSDVQWLHISVMSRVGMENKSAGIASLSVL